MTQQFASSLATSSETTKARKHRQVRRLLLEGLENRQLMAVDTTSYDLSTGVLSIWADDSATRADVSMVGSAVRISEGGVNRDIKTPWLSQIRFYGGSGPDYFKTWIAGTQLVAFGGAGNDELHGSGIRDILKGDEGADKLYGFGGEDDLYGGADGDHLDGGGGNDRLYGEAGNDTLIGGRDNDDLWGGVGDDTMFGMGGDDRLWGQDGVDKLYGDDNKEIENSGNDQLFGGYGNDLLWGGPGNDHLDGNYDVDTLRGESGNDTLVSIDTYYGEYLNGGSGIDQLWIDDHASGRDNVFDQESHDKVQRVASFANGADRTLNGDRIADPSFYHDRLWLTEPYEYRQFSNIELFDSDGPTADDVRQGGVGDCVLLSTLASIAERAPTEIRERIVDFRDGTYGVLVGGKYFRVDNDLPVWKDFGSLIYAQMSEVQSMWVAIFEKAYAIYKGNSYSSINGLNAESVFKDFQLNSIGWHWASSFNTAASLANRIDTLLRSGNQVLIGSLDRFPGDIGTARESSPLVRNHAYAVMKVIKNSSGVVTGIVVRNPWGHDGGTAAGDTSDGLVTLTPAQLLRYTETITYGKV